MMKLAYILVLAVIVLGGCEGGRTKITNLMRARIERATSMLLAQGLSNNSFPTFEVMPGVEINGITVGDFSTVSLTGDAFLEIRDEKTMFLELNAGLTNLFLAIQELDFQGQKSPVSGLVPGNSVWVTYLVNFSPGICEIVPGDVKVYLDKVLVYDTPDFSSQGVDVSAAFVPVATPFLEELTQSDEFRETLDLVNPCGGGLDQLGTLFIA